MARVYIETTIPSYYVDSRTHPVVVAWRDATRLWWDRYANGYDLCTSQYVYAELRASPAAKAQAAVALLDDVAQLSEPDGLHEVVRFYVENKLMARDAAGDAMHLALASLHGCEYLLTWNCKHLANANKTRHLGILNARLGLGVPVITTPLTLIPEEL